MECIRSKIEGLKENISDTCNSLFLENFQILGTLEASDDRSDYEEDERQWLMFDGVDNLVVSGGGTINGNGKIWWKNSCKINEDLVCHLYVNLIIQLFFFFL